MYDTQPKWTNEIVGSVFDGVFFIYIFCSMWCAVYDDEKEEEVSTRNFL